MHRRGRTFLRNLRDGIVVRRLEGLPLERDHPVKGDLAEGHCRHLVLLGGSVDLAHLDRVQVGGVGALPDEELAERGAVDVHEPVATHRLPQVIHDVVELVAMHLNPQGRSSRQRRWNNCKPGKENCESYTGGTFAKAHVIVSGVVELANVTKDAVMRRTARQARLRSAWSLLSFHIEEHERCMERCDERPPGRAAHLAVVRVGVGGGGWRWG